MMVSKPVLKKSESLVSVFILFCRSWGLFYEILEISLLIYRIQYIGDQEIKHRSIKHFLQLFYKITLSMAVVWVYKDICS